MFKCVNEAETKMMEWQMKFVLKNVNVSFPSKRDGEGKADFHSNGKETIKDIDQADVRSNVNAEKGRTIWTFRADPRLRFSIDRRCVHRKTSSL